MEMEKEVKILNLEDILPNRFQPRIQFNEKAILELSESIKEHGVIQPIVVRPIGDKYEIIAGERRYKASVLAGKTTIPAIITPLNDKDSAEIALIENVQREDLTPIEEAISYKKILDMGYLNQSTLADKLGKTQSTIANKIRLLNLSEVVQEALLNNKISERHARSLLKLNETEQKNMLQRIIDERLTVRRTDEEITKILENNSNIEVTLESQESMSEKLEEVLEIDSKVEKGGELNMSENIGIPTESIIEPVEELNHSLGTEPIQNHWQKSTIPEQSTDSTFETSEFNPQMDINSTVNPGFMDIGKIEKEAQDIFKPELEPANIDMLLTKSEHDIIEDPISPMAPEFPSELEDTTKTEDSQKPTGRFFNMFNFSETPSLSPTEDLEQKEVNMDFAKPQVNDTFMFNFNPLSSSDTIVEEPQNINSSETFDNISTFNPTPVNSVDDTVEPILSQPISDSISLEVSPFPLDNIEQSSITPISNVQNIDSTLESFQPYTLNDDEEFTLPSNNSNESVLSEPIMNNEVVPSTSILESIEPTFNIREVVKELRNCSANLEHLGYKVELEELDFQNTYQATFKISKIDE